VTQAFASLDALTQAVAQSFSAPSQAPTRSLIDVAIDFDRATEMLIRARERNDTVGIAFYEAIRQQYVDEQAAIVSGNVQQDE
jgi:BMFP domain-containing protein YqiC